MLHGRLRRLTPTAFIFLAALLLAPAARPAPARPLPASDLLVTLLSASPDALQVQGADGRAFTVKVTRATWVLRRGLVSLPGELQPGETVRVRLGRGAGGPALLVCDAETADALAAARGRALSGTLLGVTGRVWTVQPDGSGVPLPLLTSARTLFRAGGASASASAFGPGAIVTVTTRGLANGLLAAVSVSDVVPDVPGPSDAGPTPRPAALSGVVVEARPDLGLLTFQDASGVSHAVAIDAATRVRSAGKAATLGELAAGMRVRVRLGTGADAAGNPVAASASASAGKVIKGKGRRGR